MAKMILSSEWPLWRSWFVDSATRLAENRHLDHFVGVVLGGICCNPLYWRALRRTGCSGGLLGNHHFVSTYHHIYIL